MAEPAIVTPGDLVATAGILFYTGNPTNSTDPETFTSFPGVEEVTPITQQRDDIDVTPLSATAEQMVPMPLEKNGTLGITYRMYDNEPLQDQIQTDYSDSVVRNYRLDITPSADDAIVRLSGAASKTIAITAAGVVTLVGLDFTTADVQVGDAIVIATKRYIISAVNSATGATVSNPPSTAVAATSNFTIEEGHVVFSFAAYVNDITTETPKQDFRTQTATLKITGKLSVEYV